MADNRAPRISGKALKNHNGAVRIVGKVASVNGPSGVVETGDKTRITVLRAEHDSKDNKPNPWQLVRGKFNSGSSLHLQNGHIEVIGEVQSDGSLKSYVETNLGAGFDLENYEKMLQLLHGKYRYLFLQ